MKLEWFIIGVETVLLVLALCFMLYCHIPEKARFVCRS